VDRERRFGTFYGPETAVESVFASAGSVRTVEWRGARLELSHEKVV
jgi:hypothetical protein